MIPPISIDQSSPKSAWQGPASSTISIIEKSAWTLTPVMSTTTFNNLV